MHDRHEIEREPVRELAAKLRASAPALFADRIAVSPPSLSPPQPARELPAIEPNLPSLSSVMRPIAERIQREEAARLEAGRRAADPIERQADRLGSLAHAMSLDDVREVEEVLQLAKDERAGGDSYLSDALAQEMAR